jgi:hypothetical protein
MGRTVYGVDLEESPFGGLIEKLLTEEELEKLADGGAPGAASAAPDGGTDDEDDDWSVSDDTYGSSGDAEPDDEAESEVTDTEADDASGSDSGGTSSWSPSSPSPQTAPDEEYGGYGSDAGYGDSTGFGAGAGLGAGGYEDADDEGFLSKHKWLLLKVVVALAALAAVGAVVYRYKDRLAGLVPARGGDESDDGFDLGGSDGAGTDDDADVSPARRRAKAGADAPGEDADSEEADGDREAAPRRSRRDRDEGVETPGQDLDLGALVGLGVLTLIAALVRKYDEERNRPHDPLVDGPLDDSEDEVMDDDH